MCSVNFLWAVFVHILKSVWSQNPIYKNSKAVSPYTSLLHKILVNFYPQQPV